MPNQQQGMIMRSSPYFIQAIAELLFDNTQKQHQLAQRFRPVLVAAAAAYTRACAADIEQPHYAARDMLLNQSHGLEAKQHLQAACVVALQGKKIRPEREPSFVALGERAQQRVLSIVAILHLADELNKAYIQRLRIEYVADITLITLDGSDVSRALLTLSQARERWDEFIGPIQIGFESLDDSYQLTPTPISPMSVEALQDSTILAGEMARRMLRRFFERMLIREAAVRSDDQAEDIHQMRVATRRLRTSLQIVENVFEPKIIRDFRRSLYHIADLLGTVRDLDVFLEGLASFTVGEGAHADLSALVASASTARDIARLNLRHALENTRYLRFRRDFARFVTLSNTHLAKLPAIDSLPRVRDVAGSALWQRFEQLRAFEDGVIAGDMDILHRARIAGKRMRYTLEFYREILGPDTDELLKHLIALQDQLGHVQDLTAARVHINALEMHQDVGTQHYLRYLEMQDMGLLESIPHLWEQVTGPLFRSKLYGMIIEL